MSIDQKRIADEWLSIQDEICKRLEAADGSGHFITDNWERPEGGGGRSRVMEGGRRLEKGGVLFSAVHGELPESAARALGVAGGGPFFATGVSIVLHPRSAHCPIIHMNIRYFETGERWWFGGGIDLTPHYIDRDDARWFHQKLKAVCDQHEPGFYPKFKAWADDYFFLKHRNETRGVGGIFYDHLDEKTGLSKGDLFCFTADVGRAFAPIYAHFLEKNGGLPNTEAEKRWQMLRRGRYVEFNLVWDRGTKFGLETNGRTESILMSMPPRAEWGYDLRPEPGSPEEATQNLLIKGVDWLA